VIPISFKAHDNKAGDNIKNFPAYKKHYRYFEEKHFLSLVMEPLLTGYL